MLRLSRSFPASKRLFVSLKSNPKQIRSKAKQIKTNPNQIKTNAFFRHKRMPLTLKNLGSFFLFPRNNSHGAFPLFQRGPRGLRHFDFELVSYFGFSISSFPPQRAWDPFFFSRETTPSVVFSPFSKGGLRGLRHYDFELT
jgi:hypothetical protein